MYYPRNVLRSADRYKKRAKLSSPYSLLLQLLAKARCPNNFQSMTAAREQPALYVAIRCASVYENPFCGWAPVKSTDGFPSTIKT